MYDLNILHHLLLFIWGVGGEQEVSYIFIFSYNFILLYFIFFNLEDSHLGYVLFS